MTTGPDFAEGEGASSGTFRWDPWLTPIGSRLVSLASSVFTELERRRMPGDRTPRADAVGRRRLIICNVVSNLAAAILVVGPGSRVAITAAHSAITRYDRPGFPSQAIAQSIRGLESSGLLHRYPGSRGNAVTTLEPSDALLTMIAEHGVTLQDIGRAPGAETIILKAAGIERGDPKRQIDYADTPETRRLRAEMERINAFINSAKVTIEGCPQLPVRLTRQFQIHSAASRHRFTAHGRIYGGWWIDMPKAERHRIRIGGKPCADLDFTAMLTCLAYARVGRPLPEGDPYSGIAGLEEPTPEQRQAIKQGINALYFRSGPMLRLPDEVKAGLGPDWTASRFMAAVSERHGPIAPLFGSGIGLKLLHTESCIMVRTLINLIGLGVVALPIHDGCLVAAPQMDLATDTMRSASRAIVGGALPVKARLLTQQLSAYGSPAPSRDGDGASSPALGTVACLPSPAATSCNRSDWPLEDRHVRRQPEVSEPLRVFRRLFRLSHAATAGSSSMA